MEININNINIEKLRKDLIDYFGSAMIEVSRYAIIDLTKIEFANDYELIQIAINNNFDLEDYLIIRRCL